MDYYLNYDICCVLSLCSVDLVLKFDDLQYFGNYNQNVQLHKLTGFFINEHTGHIVHYDTSHSNGSADIVRRHIADMQERSFIYVNNIIDTIVDLYNQQVQEDVDIVNTKSFFAITQYLKTFLKKTCTKYNTTPERTHFVLIIPNEWESELQIVSNVLLPILMKAGFKLSQEGTVAIMTELGASLLHLQLNPSGKIPLTFIQNENKCIMYDLHIVDEKVVLQSTFFLLKEDFYLKAFNERYFTPKIISIEDRLELDYEDLSSALAQLKAENDMDKTQPKLSHDITNNILGNFSVYMEQEHRAKRNPYFTISEKVSKSFINVTRKLLATDLISKVALYIDKQNTKFPYFRKSVIVNECIEDRDKLENVEIFRYLFETLVKAKYKKAEQQPVICNNLYTKALPGAILQVVRRAMVGNISLPPIVVAEAKARSSIGIPLYYPFKFMKNNNAPKIIVYLDISYGLTTIAMEMVDKDGFIQQSIFSTMKRKIHSLEPDMKSLSHYCEFKLVNTSSKKMKSSLNEYTKILTRIIRKKMAIKREYLGYVICFDRQLLQNLSKEEILNECSTNDKILIKDQGEKLVWDMLQTDRLKPSSYYVHTHMCDSYIYLKLHQIIDVKDSDTSGSHSQTLFIKDRLINTRGIYEQVVKGIWCHIQSLDDNKKKEFHSVDGSDSKERFELFSEKFIRFLKEKFFNSYCKESRSCSMLYNFDISKGDTITLSSQQIIEIGIVPVLQKQVSQIIFCLMDTDAFGYYDIDRLYVTGNSVETEKHNETCHHIILSTLRKEFKRLIREKTYKTQLVLSIDTCKYPTRMLEVSSCKVKRARFCDDVFLWGELKAVASTTLFVKQTDDSPNASISLDSSIRYNQAHSLLIRGEKLDEKRQRVNFRPGGTHNRDFFGFGLVLFRYNEPYDLLDYQSTKRFVDPSPQNHHLAEAITPKSLVTVQVENLQYRSCIKITCEHHHIEWKTYVTDTKTYIFGERQTLRYF